jgi:hypothetical protein
MRHPRFARAGGPASMSGVAMVAMVTRYHPTTHGPASTGSFAVGATVLAIIFGLNWLIRRRRS